MGIVNISRQRENKPVVNRSNNNITIFFSHINNAEGEDDKISFSLSSALLLTQIRLWPCLISDIYPCELNYIY